MTYTYTQDPANEPRDEVRFLLGDVVETTGSLSDAEVLYLIGKNDGNIKLAAADAAEAMAARYVEKSNVSKTVGDLTISQNHSDTADRYYALASKLRTGGTTSTLGAPRYDDGRDNVFWVGMGDASGGGKFTRLP